MPQPEALLDTDILSAIMKGNPLAAARVSAHGLAVVTNNEDHFRRVPGLQVANWLRP